MNFVLKKTIYILLSCISLNVLAQDAHYWTNQFGPRSVLLGGAVVGGSKDHSASYYNAAGLSFSDSVAGISITSTAYQMEHIKYVNGAGKGLDLKSNNIQIVPLIVTGKLNLKKIPRLSLGYFMVERGKTAFKSSARADGFFDVINDNSSPGQEEYVSQYTSSYDMHEMNAGIGIGYRLSDKFSIGITNYGAYRTTSEETNHIARLIPNQGLFALSSYDRIINIHYKNIRTIIKLAAMLNLKKLKIGLTVTAPSINIWGSSIIAVNETYSNIYIPELDTAISYFADDRQEIKRTTYKTPASVALGIQYNFTERSKVYITSEWFDKVPLYTQVQPEVKNFLRPSNYGFEGTSADYLKMTEARTSIVNVAIGFEQTLTKKINLLMGARTNYNSVIPNYTNEIKLSHTPWDLYHFSLGGSYARTKSNINVGVLLSYGTAKNLPQLISITNPQASGDFPLQGPLTNTNTGTYFSYSFMLGYIYHIK